jgi:hypothetical protein
VLRADLQLIACFCHCVAFVFLETLVADFSVVAKLSAASMVAGRELQNQGKETLHKEEH